MTQHTPSNPNIPSLCFYYHGKPLHVLHHNDQWWLHSSDVLAVIGRRLGHRIQQLLSADPNTGIAPVGKEQPECWLATLLRVLRRSGKPWRGNAKLVEQRAIARAGAVATRCATLGAGSGTGGGGRGQVSHAVLQAVLTQGTRWQHSHWLLTLDYTPDHPLRHAHGRLLGLNSSATPLQALAQQIGIAADNGELLVLASACHQQLRDRLQRQARRVMQTG
jgi:hypothetical protein